MRGSEGPSNSDDRSRSCLAGMELSFVATGEKEGRIRSRFVVDALWIRGCVYRARLKSHSQVARIVQARPVQAAVVSNSSNKIHQTWERKFRPSLHSTALVPYGHCSMINDACSSYAVTRIRGRSWRALIWNRHLKLEFALSWKLSR